MAGPDIRRTWAAPSRVIALVIALAAISAVVPAAAGTALGGAEARLLALQNRERTSRGMAALSAADDLVAVARRHSQRMAEAGAGAFHNPRPEREVSGWIELGENVGAGASVEAIHEGFMGSPEHRELTWHRDFDHAGVGVLSRGGTVYVTIVYARRAARIARPVAERPRSPVPARARSPSTRTSPPETLPYRLLRVEAEPSPGPAPAIAAALVRLRGLILILTEAWRVGAFPE